MPRAAFDVCKKKQISRGEAKETRKKKYLEIIFALNVTLLIFIYEINNRENHVAI